MQQDYTTLLQIHLDEPYKKLDPEYGLKVMKALYEQTNTQWYKDRLKRWQDNIKLANGDIDMTNFKKMLNIEGEQAYIALDYTAPKIFNKYEQSIVGGFMGRNEMSEVDAIDDNSLSKKEDEKLTARFRMKHRQDLAAAQEDSGVQLVPDGAFIPEDEDQFHSYFGLQYRSPEEALFTNIINLVKFDSNDKQLKKQILRDILRCGFASTKVERDVSDNIIMKHCVPINTVHNLFLNENGQGQLQFVGEVYFKKVKDIRLKYKLAEDVVFKVAKMATNSNASNLMWQDTFRDLTTRPYDDYNVPVFDVEVATVDNEFFVIKTDASGTDVINDKKAKPNPTSEKATPITKSKENIYEGVWIVGSDIVLEWGIGKDLVTPYSNTTNKKFKHSIIIPNNDGGYMPALIENAVTAIRQLILTRLKIQHLTVELKPSGIAVDYGRLGSGLSTGTGGEFDKLEVLRIYNTKGSVFYDSVGDDPMNPNRSLPIQELGNGADVAKLNQLVALHNFWVDVLKGDIGSNDAADGTTLPTRYGEGVTQAQIQSFNNNTRYVYDGYLSLLEETYNKVCMMAWDDVVLKGKKFKMQEGYTPDLMDASFRVRVKMMPTEQEMATFENMLNNCIKSGSIAPDEAFKFLKTAKENMDLAYMQLNREADKKRKQAEQQELAKIDRTNKGAAEAAQSATQGKLQELKEELNNKALLQSAKLSGDKETALITFATQLSLQSFNLDKPIPGDIKPMIDYILKNAITPMQQEELAAQQKQQQEQEQAAQQTAMNNQQEEQTEPVNNPQEEEAEN